MTDVTSTITGMNLWNADGTKCELIFHALHDFVSNEKHEVIIVLVKEQNNWHTVILDDYTKLESQFTTTPPRPSWPPVHGQTVYGIAVTGKIFKLEFDIDKHCVFMLFPSKTDAKEEIRKKMFSSYAHEWVYSNKKWISTTYIR